MTGSANGVLCGDTILHGDAVKSSSLSCTDTPDSITLLVFCDNWGVAGGAGSAADTTGGFSMVAAPVRTNASTDRKSSFSLRIVSKLRLSWASSCSFSASFDFNSWIRLSSVKFVAERRGEGVDGDLDLADLADLTDVATSLARSALPSSFITLRISSIRLLPLRMMASRVKPASIGNAACCKEDMRSASSISTVSQSSLKSSSSPSCALPSSAVAGALWSSSPSSPIDGTGGCKNGCASKLSFVMRLLGSRSSNFSSTSRQFASTSGSSKSKRGGRPWMISS